MSSRSKVEASNVNLTPARQDVLDAAINPLLEQLEARSMFTVNVAPVANPGGPYTVAEGQSVMISGLASTDSDGTVASYQWDTNYSSSRGFRNQVQSPTWNFTADDSGTKYIALKVVDNTGAVSSLVTTQINVSDVAPTLSLTLPGGAQEASPVNVSWSYTDAGQSDAVNAWNVDWGDGTNTNYSGTATGGVHTYDSDGTYDVTLTATQTDATTQITQQLVVSNVSPVVSLSTPNGTTVDEGARVKLNFASPNRQGTLDSWLVDWGDGKQDVFSPSTSSSLHLYTDSGNYTATVYAQEPDGGYGQATQAFVVNNVAPVVTQTGVPSTGTEGTSMTIGSTVVDGGIDDTHTYGWSVYKDGSHFALPGGTNLTGTSFTFTPTDNGSYVARLTVVDDEGASTTVNSSAIAVANATPTASVTGEPGSSIAEGTAVNLTVTAADAGSLDTFTYSWSVAKGGNAFALPNGTNTTAANFSFTPTDNGTYAATCVVTDKDGAHVNAYSTAIVVTNENPTAAITGTPATGVEGTQIGVSAGVTDAGTADTFSYAWSVLKDGNAYTLPGGVSTTGSTFAFTPTDNGSYEIELTVVDDDNGAASVTSSAIVVANAAPTADLTGPTTGTEGHGLTFNVAAHDAGTLDTHQYLWTVEKDGQAYGLNGATDNLAAFTFMPEDDGTYVVSVLVTDSDHDTVTMTQTVTVANLAPAPAIDSQPATANEGDSVTVTGSATDAGVNDSLTYAWTLTKDNVAVDVSGLTTNGTSFTFTPADNGSYVATLTVTDNDTAHASVSTSAIVVANVDPTAVVAGEPGTNINEGDAVALTATASDAGTADTFGYAWSIKKNGVAWTPASGTVLTAQTLNFSPTDNGSYVATVVVTDKDGGHVTVASSAIVVDNVDPTAAITAPASSPEGTALSLTSTVTDAGLADTHTYLWSVTKDGNAVDLTGITTNASGFNFTPVDNGAYVVSLVVTDDDNGTTTTTSNITVTNAAPVPVISGNSSVNEDQAITLTVAANDPGVNDTHTYLWSVTRNGSNYATNLGATNGTSFTFTPNLYGSYVVSCVVTDNGTAAATATKAITVNNVAPTAAITGLPSGPRAEGSPITLHGAAGDVSGESGLTYLWSVKRGNVTFPLTGVTTNTQNFEFTPTDNGLYKATLTVTDSGGLSTSVTTSNMVVTNALPDAAMTGIPGGNVNEGSAVNLHVDAADPATEDVLSYAWTVTKNGQPFTLPGGTVANTANFTFVPTDNGTYVATCLVTDDDGGPVSVNSGAINVVNVDPVGSISRVGSGTIYEGTALTYAAVVTDAGTADTHTYAWTATKDGQAYALSNADQQQISFTPENQGSYVLTLVVTDDDAGVHTSTQTVTVLNANPVVGTDTAASTGTEGVAFNFSGSATDAGVNDLLTYTWTVTKPDNSTATINGTSGSFTPADNGTYSVRLTVADADGGSVQGAAHTVVVANANPSIDTVTVPTTGSEGVQISATASASDVAADTVSYAWSVTKDGQAYTLDNTVVTNAANFAFTPSDNGSYELTLTATDEDGGIATSSHTVAVANVNPTATITADATGDEGTAVNASVSASDVAADTLSYAWTVTKDGHAYTLPGGVITTGVSLAFTPTDNGSYVATCVVSDEDGGSVSKVSSAIVVSNVIPTVSVARVGSGTITEGDTVQFAATATDAGSDDVLSYLWTATKDGQSYALTNATAATLDFTPSDEGSYVLTCTVTDDDAGVASASTSAITVINAGPVITTDAVATTGTEGVAISLTGDATDAGVADVLTYVWTITKPDNSTVTLNGKDATFTPADNGSYTAQLVVTDGDTGTATGSLHTIVVANAAPAVTAIDAPATAAEGSAITASVTATDVVADTVTLAWTVTKDGQAYALPNGTVTDAASLVFTPTDNGSYTLTLVATDEDNGTTTVTHNVTVANANPTAAVTGDTSANEGSAVSVEVAASDVSSDDLAAGFTYAWSVTKNGLAYALPQGTAIDADTLAWTPADNGTYAASVIVTDKDNGTVTQTHTIVVDNVAPTAALGTVATTGNEGSAISVSATASDAGTEDTIEYSWVVEKDGEIFQAATDLSSTASGFNFTPTDNGSYVVKLYVTDGMSGNFYQTSAITVANVAPTGTVSGPATGNEGSAVTITATAADASSVDTLGYAWTVTKDGEAFTLPQGTVTNAAEFTFTPTDEGAYVASVVVSDDDNGSVTLTHELTVANVAPTVALTDAPVTGVEGTAITVNGTASDVGSDTLARTWSVYKNGNLFTLPNGTTTSGNGLTFTPTDNGSYVVRLSVNDGTTSTSVDSEAIVVSNAAPEASITGDSEVSEGTEAEFSGTATDAGSLDAAAGFTYAWKARKGNSVVATGDARDFSFTPSVHGEYSVQLVVTDKDGTTVTTYSSLSVANVAPKNVAIEGELEGIKEGDSVHMVASADDVAGDNVSLAWKVMYGESVYASGTGDEIDFTAARGQYSIVVTATDTAGATASDSVDIDVANVTPTATLASSQNGSVLTGANAVFNLMFDDVPANQALDVSWNFGDGSSASNSFTGGSSVVKKHAYTEHGTYTVTATVSDGQNQKVVSTTIVVSEAAMIADPMDPSKTALLVIGGDGNDVINVAQTRNGRYSVDVNGDNVGSGFSPTGRIYVYGNGGSNAITVTGTKNAVVFAGSASSSVTTGSGNDIIIGTAGADRLNGGDGRDVIVGMADKDVLRGGDGEDLLIAGSIAKTDTASLASLGSKWADGNGSTSARRNAVLGIFNKKSLIADNGGNQLYGESKNDWFVIGSADKIKDLQKTDSVN